MSLKMTWRTMVRRRQNRHRRPNPGGRQRRQTPRTAAVRRRRQAPLRLPGPAGRRVNASGAAKGGLCKFLVHLIIWTAASAQVAG